MLGDLFKAVLVMSVAGGSFIGLIIAARPITKRFFGIRWQYYIWVLALAVLILPVFVLANPQTVYYTAADTVSAVNSAAAPIADKGVDKMLLLSGAAINAAALVWLFVAFAVIAFRIIKYAVFIKNAKKCSRIPHDVELLSTDFSVYICPALESPVLTGLFHTVLFLPERRLDSDAIECIFAHETVHYKRHDLWYKWAVMLISALHWFNPAVYIAAGMIDEDCEFSCDAEVTQNMTAGERRIYMKTILDLIPVKLGRYSPTAGMSGAKKLIIKRFKAINTPKGSVSAGAATVSVIAAAAVTFGAFHAGTVFAASTDMFTAYEIIAPAATIIESIPSSRQEIKAETNPTLELSGSVEQTETIEPIVSVEPVASIEPINSAQPTITDEETENDTFTATEKTETAEAEREVGENTYLIESVPETEEGGSGYVLDGVDTVTETAPTSVPEKTIEGRESAHEALGTPSEVTPDNRKETYEMNDGTEIVLKYNGDDVYEGYRIIK